MKALAVTGGIGSGKSYIIKMFSALGIPVYDADSRTKELYIKNPVLLSSLKRILGDDIVSDCRIDRRLMASRLFGNFPKMKEVENVVFPAVLEDIRKWKASQEGSGAPFVIIESAIFLEKPIFRNTADKVLAVSAPAELRIRRVMQRDGATEDAVSDRMKHQWSDEERESLSDFVVISDGERPLLPQVAEIYDKMKNY